jgi:N-acetylglucosamine malate deacetylase 2
MDQPVLLVVVAHPDDETFGTGSVIAHAAREGRRVVVCCATRGEAGVDTSGTTASPEELARVREAELHAAARVMGAAEVRLLQFADSGMTGAMPPGALAAVPIADVVASVGEVIAAVAPHVVVTLNPEARDDHRDHLRIAEATTVAFASSAPPGARLYQWVIPTSIITPWLAEFRESGTLDAYVDLDLGRPDEDVTTIVDVRAVADIRRAAIAEHKTQTSPFSAISPAMYDKILANDHFVRVVPAWEGGPIETAL